MAVFVVDKNGKPLMPTERYGKVRHLLKEGRAVIESRHPFTIRLTYDTPGITQPVEMCVDTGYIHIGISVKSEKEEILSAQYDLLADEKERHDERRKYRRNRRNRKRYRASKFNNRTASKPEGWIPPSLKNKADRHLDLINSIIRVCPVTNLYLEMGSFDTMLLKAIQEGKPIPHGTDYQHGEQYHIDTLRAAVFERDGHKCRFCGRGVKDKAILHAHHIYYWRRQHGNSMSELITCCELCHTPANHEPGGILYKFDKKLPRYSGAAFINTVRWYLWNSMAKMLTGSAVQMHMTYGTLTKHARKKLNLEKSHVNDAYSMGRFHPKIRAVTEYFVKRRRNNRILEKFYDAKYIDIRDGDKKSGSQLSCGRTNRRELRNSGKNFRIYRGKKASKGRRSIRRTHYPVQPGDIVVIEGEKYTAVGTHCNGTRVIIKINNKQKSVTVSKVSSFIHTGGWTKIL